MQPTDEADDKRGPSYHEHAFWRQITTMSVSAGMVGVCMTTIGLIAVLESLSEYRTLCDILLFADAVVFATSAALAFIALRQRFRGPWLVIQTVAEGASLLGMVLMVMACMMLALAIA